MKEIDFLPKWYKSDRRRRISYRAQYAALGGVFAVMMVWNFIAVGSISRTEAKLAQAELQTAGAESTSREFNEIKNEVTCLQKKADILKEIDSRVDVASILAEISFLIDKNILLNKVELSAEKFTDGQKTGANRGSVIRSVGSGVGSKGALFFGDVRFKVVISGVAADASDVAELICRLEDSPYFKKVYPSFSRNSQIKTAAGAAGKNLQVSEFEISCYLANYKEQ